jgi:hypothetical protein
MPIGIVSQSPKVPNAVISVIIQRLMATTLPGYLNHQSTLPDPSDVLPRLPLHFDSPKSFLPHLNQVGHFCMQRQVEIIATALLFMHFASLKYQFHPKVSTAEVFESNSLDNLVAEQLDDQSMKMLSNMEDSADNSIHRDLKFQN